MLGVQHAVLVPVKAFRVAKARLAEALTPAERAGLARAMAANVVAAAGPAATFVVCDDAQVAGWAREAGATVIWRPGHGLNGAVIDGVRTIAEAGHDHVVVAHSDLPLATGFSALVHPGTITLVPDHRDDGTNVIALPARTSFAFAYGPGSFRRHLTIARASGLTVEVVHDERLALDLDTPAELAHPLVEEALRRWNWRPTNPVNHR